MAEIREALADLGWELMAINDFSLPVITLPEDVDPGKVDATYKDGILRVTLSKREASKPRRIEIN